MSDPRHVIDYSTAREWILQFITKYADAASRSLGGFIDRETIEILLANNSSNDLYGLLQWYCYYPKDNTLPYFFLSFTNMDGFDAQNPPSSPGSSNDYYRSATIHVFSGSPTMNNVREYLENTDYSNSPPAVTIDAGNVDTLQSQYLTDFPLADNKVDYRGISCGLTIQEDTGISDLISDESCIGINYYFGITDGANPKICVILFPVDDTGFNVIDRLILEKAYP